MLSTSALEKTEDFLAGFEDDSTQEGVEALLTQIRSEITRRKTASTTVPCKRYKAHRVDVWCDGTYFQVMAKGGKEVSSFQRHSEKRHTWFGSLYLYDPDGTQWVRSTGYLLQDDFGNLVQVAA